MFTMIKSVHYISHFCFVFVYEIEINDQTTEEKAFRGMLLTIH